jgi:C4-dicarboxylate-specific signal transduction histidine kinase
VFSLRSRRQTLRALNEERDQLEARVAQRTLELMVANTKLEQQATTDR